LKYRLTYNLDILRRYIRDKTVDLIHLAPPFKGNQRYNILFGGAERHPLGI
jgi:hypothetical protein